jgi:BMFP domain-containing protein YqiC
MSKAKNNLIDRLIESVNTIVPEGLGELQKDLKEQMRVVFIKVLNECHIVTQDEFAAYTKALERTQKRVQALEQKLTKLEKK